MNLVLRALVVLCTMALLTRSAMAQSNATGQLDVTTFPQPYFLLMRDPAVHDDLQLTDDQRRKVLDACYALDEQFWKLRGGTREQATTGLRELVDRLQKTAAPVLTAAQRQRLGQIQIQIAGFGVFQRPEVAKALGLSDTQQKSIKKAVDKYQELWTGLQKRFQDGEDQEKLKAEASEGRSLLRATVADVLGPAALRKWQVMAGKRVDPTTLGKVRFKAPNLQGDGPWVNHQGLTSQALRGKVVALHFYAFQCINCRRNEPWYKQWHQELSDKGLVVLGIHTPELSNERDVAKVKANAAKEGLSYPILIDNDKENWSAWGNTMWPTTYLIDKEGFVRYWWLGELNWKDAGMQDVFRTHAFELLDE